MESTKCTCGLQVPMSTDGDKWFTEHVAAEDVRADVIEYIREVSDCYTFEQWKQFATKKLNLYNLPITAEAIASANGFDDSTKFLCVGEGGESGSSICSLLEV